jgi:2-oxoglutarate ferredoxin oxidoreductase subunit gamma
MTGYCEVEMAGTGGQGLALMGVILAEAAGIHDGKYVAYTEEYGTASRGGRSKSDVIISESEIDYPFVRHPDVLLALTQDAADSLAGTVSKDGIVIVDCDLVERVPTRADRVYKLPFVETARQELGKPVVANMLALAAIAVISGVVSLDALEKAVEYRSPERARQLNSKALETGVRLSRGAVPYRPAAV